MPNGTLRPNAPVGRSPMEPPGFGGASVRLLVVGADPSLRSRLARWTGDAGAGLSTAPDLRAAAKRLEDEGPFDVVLGVLDGAAAEQEDLSPWTSALSRSDGSPRVLLATDRPSVRLALDAARSGIHELVNLPPRRDELLRALARARTARAGSATEIPPAEGPPMSARALVGHSPAMLEVYNQIARVAPGTATVLIQGESGTGKELVARAIHAHGPRGNGPFVAVNCAAIPDSLLESELFGHEKGAFTGAVARRTGRFERASGGTILLDEIGDMGIAVQAKILRAVEAREIERVGNGASIPVDVRVIAATNRDLRAAVAEGRFREDLFHRLPVLRIDLPPLRERGDDLELLTMHFVRQHAARHGKRIRAVTERARALLRAHRWPGNVRELANVLERAVIVSTDETLGDEDLPDELRGAAAEPGKDASPSGIATLAEAEARHIRLALDAAGGRVGEAARILGIHRNTLARKISELGL